MNNAAATQSAPYNQEAEEAVLGSVLCDFDSRTYPLLASFLKVEDFYFVRHGYIFAAMSRLHERNEPIDYLTLEVELKAFNQLEEIGGAAYITHLVNTTPTSIYAETYGRLVQRAAVRRRLMIAADAIKALALNEEITLEAVATEAQTYLESAVDNVQGRETVTAREAMHSYWDELERGREGKSPAIPVGFRDLDDILAGGLRRGDLHIIGGRPGMGKSSLMLCELLNMAKLGSRVAFFSLEMTLNQVTMRLVAAETGFSTDLLRQPEKMSPEQFGRVTEAMSRLSQLPLFIDDTPAIEPVTLKAKVKRLMYQYGLDALFVDYLQLMSGGSKFAKSNDRTREVSYVSHKLKEYAKDLNIPVIAAASLNRELERRQDKRPVLADLRESGDLEFDADVVEFLYRDVIYNEATEFPNQTDVIVAKNRNGRTGTISLYYDKQATRFTNTATRRVDLDDDYTPPAKSASKTILFSKASGGTHVSMSQPSEDN